MALKSAHPAEFRQIEAGNGTDPFLCGGGEVGFPPLTFAPVTFAPVTFDPVTFAPPPGTLRVALLPLALLKALLNALQLQAAARRLAAIEHKDRKKT